jgi:hypothetical protein
VALVLIISMNACTNSPRQPNHSSASNVHKKIQKNDSSYYIIENDSIVLLPFEIEARLSPKAKEKILTDKESIILTVFVSGTPKDETWYAKDGTFDVASAQKEISYGQLVRFENIKFPIFLFDQLLEADVDVMIYFTSGRKSSPDNLLSSHILSGKASDIVNKKFTIRGKLIAEDEF